MTSLKFQAEVYFRNGKISRTVLPEAEFESQNVVMEDLRSSIAAIVRRRIAEVHRSGKALVNVAYRETPKQQSITFRIVGVSDNA